MQLPITQRRQEIGRLLRSECYEELLKLSIKLVGPSKEYDCASYVLMSQGIFASKQALAVLQQVKRTAQKTKGIIFYCSNGSPRHYGLFDGEIVVSKWGYGPVFSHKIEDVPDYYGDEAQFREIDAQLHELLMSANSQQEFDY